MLMFYFTLSPLSPISTFHYPSLQLLGNLEILRFNETEIIRVLNHHRDFLSSTGLNKGVRALLESQNFHESGLCLLNSTDESHGPQ